MYMMVGLKKMEPDAPVVSHGRTRGNGHRLKYKKFHSNIRKNFFMLKVVKQLLGYRIICFPSYWMRMTVRAFLPICTSKKERGEQNEISEVCTPSDQKGTGGGKFSISQYLCYPGGWLVG